jgi:hypothetical protein
MKPHGSCSYSFSRSRYCQLVYFIKERLKSHFQAVEDVKKARAPYEGLFIPSSY